MNAVRNEKVITDWGCIYQMRRTVGAQEFGFALAITDEELTHYRPIVAHRLRHARTLLALTIKGYGDAA